MKRSELLNLIAERVIREHGEQPYIVAIDGVDAAGKSILAGELVDGHNVGLFPVFTDDHISDHV